MTYKKPSNVKYVDMAIYVDDHIYSDDCDEALCFEYLYHLFYMIACKGKYFNCSRDYDEYALYGASQLYMRYRNKKQFASENAKQLPKIKSCLNYIKRIAYPLRVNYQKSTFAQRFSSEDNQDSAADEIAADLLSQASRMNGQLLQADFAYYLSKITSTVQSFLQDIPYHNDPVMMHNIYLSCLLTILKSITVSRKNLKRLHSREARGMPTDDLIDSIYREEIQDSVVTYHIDKNLTNYIATLVNRIKSYIAKDLRYLIGSYEPSEQIVKSILASPMEQGSEEV